MTTSPETNVEQRREMLAFEVQQRLRVGLPQFNHLDRNEFDTYKKENDKHDRGNLLHAYTEEIVGPNTPHVIFIFRNDETQFTLNFYNNPDPRRPGGSIYGRNQSRWNSDEIDFAIERAKLHMTGIDSSDPNFSAQLARPGLTFGEFLQKTQVLVKKRGKKSAYQTLEEVKDEMEHTESITDIWTLYDNYPEKARELVVARIQANPTYTTFEGVTLPSEEVISWINENSALGDTAVKREMYTIETHERLLKDIQLLA